MKALPTHIKPATALAIAAMLTACGGGGENLGPISLSVDNTSPEKAETQNIIKRAEEKNIKKVAYKLGGGTGLYGKALERAGWTFVPVNDIKNLDNAPATIVYINSDGINANAEFYAEMLKQFRGTLVLDTNNTISSPIGNEEAKSNFSQVSKNDIEIAGKELADFYQAISGGKASLATPATAAITSASAGTILPIYIDAENKINGYSPQDIDAISPQTYALTASQILDGKLANPSTAYTTKHEDKAEVQNITGVNWDRIVDIDGQYEGWNWRGRMYILASREQGPTFLNARKYVDVVVDSGSNDVGCMVNGNECGVYPVNKFKTIHTTSTTGTGTVWIKHAPTRYQARIRVKPYQQIMQFQPKAESWTSDSTKDIDSWETTWSKGFSVGVSAGYSTSKAWSMGFSGGFSRSQSYRKRTYAWVGYDNNWIDSNGYLLVESGIKSVNQKARGAFRSDAPFKNTSTSGSWEAVYNALLNGTYWKCSDAMTTECYEKQQKVNGNGSPRSKIAWEGWNPAVTAQIEIPKNTFTSPSETTHTVTVYGGFATERRLWKYNWVEANSNGLSWCVDSMYSKQSGYVLEGVTDKKCTEGNVVSPTATNSSSDTDGWKVPATLYASYFNN